MTTRRSYRKSPRLENDQYFTPAWMTLALLRGSFLNYGVSPTILEPCVGDGAISRILARETDARLVTNDLFPNPALTPDFTLDARLSASWDMFGQPDFVVGNPTFEFALPIIQNAVERARLGVAMILRLSFAEPCEDRSDWLAEHPFSLIVMPRHKFRKDRKGTDQVTTAWFLWDKAEREFPNVTLSRKERDSLIEVDNHANRYSTDAGDDPRPRISSEEGGASDLPARPD